MALLHSLVLLTTACSILFCTQMASAATYQLTQADQIKLESLSIECSQPGEECPKLPLENLIDVVYLQKGDEYSLVESEEEVIVVQKDGLFVVFNIYNETKEPIEVRRFFPMSKVDLSTDSDYYMCEKGQEFTLSSEVDLTQIGLDPSLAESNIFDSFKPTTFVCKCFWAPQSLFDELGIEKIGKKPTNSPEEPDDLIDLILAPVKSNYHYTKNHRPKLHYRSRFGGNPRSKNPWNPPGENPATPWSPPGNTPTYPAPPIPSVGSECGLIPFMCVYNMIRNKND